MKLLQKELDALSEQHTRKCLENSQLYQELQDEREALVQCQKENQGLQEKQVKAHAWEFGVHCESERHSQSLLLSKKKKSVRRRKSLSSSSCQMGNNRAIPLG